MRLGFVLICFAGLFGLFAAGEPAKPATSAPTPALTPAPAPAAAAAVAPAWHSDGARYRLEIERDHADAPQYLDLRHLTLPAKLDNGVRVYDAEGKETPYLLYDDFSLALPGKVKPGNYYVYFGYDAKQPFDAWDEKLGERIGNDKLHIKIVNSNSLATSDEEWRQIRLQNLERRYARNYENNEKNYHRILVESLFGATLFSKYPGEMWMPGNNVYQLKLFAMRKPQEKFKCVRRNWRYWAGYSIPFWYEPLQRRNYFYRLQGPMRQFVNLPNSWRKEIEKTMAEPPGVAERDLLGVFESKNARVQGDAQVREINLPKRPFDSNGNYAIRYNGRLLIEEDGEYEFGTNSNSLMILRLDGKELIIQAGKRKPSEMKIESAKIHLTRGVHEFELFYHKSKVTTSIAALYRKVGDPEYKLLSDENFHPAAPARVLGCIAHDGTRYPVLRRNDRFMLHTGKRDKISLQSFAPVVPKELDFSWLFGGETLSGNDLPLLALHAGKDNELVLKPADPAWAQVPVTCYPATYNPISIDTGLFLKLWLPLFIYNDEELDWFREVNSKMPLPLHVRLRTIPSREQEVFPADTEVIALAAKPTEATDRFAEDVTDKATGKLDGEELAAGLEVEFELSLPGQVFERRKVRFLTVDELPNDLAATPDGLADGFGNRIVPVLTRPTLHNLRAWELPKTVGNAIQGPGKLLVIGEDFGEGDTRFSRVLAKLAKARGYELEFLPWAADGRKSGSRLLDSLPELLPLLDVNTAHSAIVIPPSRGRNPALSPWENERILALVLEKLRASGTLRELAIATPLPSVDEADAERDGEFIQTLRRLKREYGAEMIELEMQFKADPDYRKSYQADGVASSYPVGATERAAELLLKNVR